MYEMKRGQKTMLKSQNIVKRVMVVSHTTVFQKPGAEVFQIKKMKSPRMYLLRIVIVVVVCCVDVLFGVFPALAAADWLGCRVAAWQPEAAMCCPVNTAALAASGTAQHSSQ